MIDRTTPKHFSSKELSKSEPIRAQKGFKTFFCQYPLFFTLFQVIFHVLSNPLKCLHPLGVYPESQVSINQNNLVECANITCQFPLASFKKAVTNEEKTTSYLLTQPHSFLLPQFLQDVLNPNNFTFKYLEKILEIPLYLRTNIN